MFYPVRILDAQGKIKKVVSSRQLSREYWRDFDKLLAQEFAGKSKKRPRTPRPLERHLFDDESLETD